MDNTEYGVYEPEDSIDADEWAAAIASPNQLRAEIEARTAEFLAAGGRIELIEPCLSTPRCTSPFTQNRSVAALSDQDKMDRSFLLLRDQLNAHNRKMQKRTTANIERITAFLEQGIDTYQGLMAAMGMSMTTVHTLLHKHLADHPIAKKVREATPQLSHKAKMEKLSARLATPGATFEELQKLVGINAENLSLFLRRHMSTHPEVRRIIAERRAPKPRITPIDGVFYLGKTCSKHPELNGKRYLNGALCVGCRADKSARYRESQREVAQHG